MSLMVWLVDVPSEITVWLDKVYLLQIIHLDSSILLARMFWVKDVQVVQEYLRRIQLKCLATTVNIITE